MKIAVVGAGSTYTPELVEGVLARLPLLPVTELALHDTDSGRLEVLSGLAARMVAAKAAPISVTSSTDLVEVVSAATFVLIQLRVGQQPARILDETLPQRFDLLGQETTGPGGFGKAMRTVPVVRAIAQQVRLHAPDAWILNFTNPVGVVTRALLDDGHRAVGLCNVAAAFTRHFAQLLAVEPDEVELDHAGLNHLTWIRSVRVAGREQFPQLLTPPLRERIAEDIEQSSAVLDHLGAIPSYYLKYFYDTRASIEKQQAAPRVREVQRLERELLAMYADPALDIKPRLLDERGGAHYSDVASALMCSLHTGDGARHYVNVRNGSVIRGLALETVVEVPATVDRDGAHPQPVADFPPEILSLVQSVAAYEALTLDAARTGDRSLAVRALVAHPLVREVGLAEAYLDALLAEDGHAPELR